MDIKRPSDSICQLLLLLSRPKLSDREIGEAKLICARITDWEVLVHIASSKFSLPWVHLHLSRIGPPRVSEPVLKAMQQAVKPMTMQSLGVASELALFHRAVIQPLQVAHVYIKGPSLAAQYHGDLGIRFSRDIDILVSTNDQKAVVDLAVGKKYKIWNDHGSAPIIPDPRYLRALLRYETTVTLVSPNGVIIEVHKNVDKNSGLFNSEDLLDAAEEIDFVGLKLNVLPIHTLFTYICYHNTRHIWSRLHWLADLDAIIHHHCFDELRALEHAEYFGLRPTVEACLDFNQLSKNPPQWEGASASRHGLQILNLCLNNLAGDLELEYSLRVKYGLLGLPFDWLLQKGIARRVAARHLMSRLKPSFAQYQVLPLPDSLQFLYYLTRPIGAITRRVSHNSRLG